MIDVGREKERFDAWNDGLQYSDAEECAAWRAWLAAKKQAAKELGVREMDGAQPLPSQGNWISAENVNQLVRELDVALNGEEGAAIQASLCDIVAQVKSGHWKLVRQPSMQAMEEVEPAMQKFRAASRALHPKAVSTLVEEGLEIVDALYAKKGGSVNE